MREKTPVAHGNASAENKQVACHKQRRARRGLKRVSVLSDGARHTDDSGHDGHRHKRRVIPVCGHGHEVSGAARVPGRERGCAGRRNARRFREGARQLIEALLDARLGALGGDLDTLAQVIDEGQPAHVPVALARLTWQERHFSEMGCVLATIVFQNGQKWVSFNVSFTPSGQFSGISDFFRLCGFLFVGWAMSWLHCVPNQRPQCSPKHEPCVQLADC